MGPAAGAGTGEGAERAICLDVDAGRLAFAQAAGAEVDDAFRAAHERKALRVAVLFGADAGR